MISWISKQFYNSVKKGLMISLQNYQRQSRLSKVGKVLDTFKEQYRAIYSKVMYFKTNII